jgi:DNA gyrase subunit A
VDEISVLGRNTQGVRLIRLAEGERLTGIERIEHLEGEVVDEAGDTSSGDTSSGDTPSTDSPSGDAPPEGAPESEN